MHKETITKFFTEQIALQHCDPLESDSSASRFEIWNFKCISGQIAYFTDNTATFKMSKIWFIVAVMGAKFMIWKLHWKIRISNLLKVAL